MKEESLGLRKSSRNTDFSSQAGQDHPQLGWMASSRDAEGEGSLVDFPRSNLACKEEMFNDLQRNVSLHLEALGHLWAGWLCQGNQDRGVPGLPA